MTAKGTAVLVLSLAGIYVGIAATGGCSGTSTGTGTLSFCDSLASALAKCGTCPSASNDCTKLSGLVNPSLLDGATKCVQASDCSNGGPLACLAVGLGTVTPTADQSKLANDYCTSCSVVGGDPCQSAFFGGDGSATGPGYVLLPFGSAPVSAVTTKCTSSSLGKTACEASFATCAEVEMTNALATSVSVDTANCLVKAIKTGASVGTGPDARTDADAGAGDAGQVCNSVTNVAAFVTWEVASGTMPTPSGGAVMDGTYTLLSARVYTTRPLEPSTAKRTVVISNGTQLNLITEISTGIQVTASGVYTSAGTTFTRTYTCPEPKKTTVSGYTATPTSLTLYFGPPYNEVLTYGRQ